MHCDKDNDTHSVEEDLQASNIVDSEEEDPNQETVSSESIDNRSHRTNQQQPNGISEDKSSSSSRSIGRHNNDQNKSFDGEGTMASATMSNSTSKFTLETEDLQSPTNTSSTTTTTTASSDRKATATSSAETSTIGDSSCKNCDCIEQKEEEVDVKKRHIDATMAQINTTLGDSGNKEELSVVADDTDVQKIDENRILPAISSISTTTNRSNQISEKQQSHNSSSTVETRISNGRVGAFREGRQEPSSPLPEADDILQSQEQNDAAEEVSTPMLVHATLVVEKDGDDEGEREELRERLTPAVPDHPQSSESNDAHETTADNAERGDGNPTTVAPVHHQFGSNVVVQNVFMDEEQHIEMAPTRNNNASSAGDGPGCPSHSSSSQLVVQATQIDVDKPRKFYQKRAFWGLVMIAVLVIVLATVLPLRNEQVSNVETNNKPPPPSGRPNDSEETTDDVVGDDDYLDDLGNTIEGFVQYSLPEFSRLALQDTTSPQSLALEWLWEDPDFTSDLPNFRRIQRFALATLFFAMANDEDVNNVERTNWLTPDHECEWLTNDSPITKCPDGDRWRTIELSDFKLQKAFPPEIGLLTDLVSIDVSINRRVTGSLPTEIGLLTNMDQLFMERTGLTGPIPSELGMMTKLRSLNLAENQLTSTLPSELGLLNNLYSLHLGENQLTGTISKELFLNNVVLQSFEVHLNALSGAIPTEIGLTESLRTLVLAQNDLSGTIPTSLGNLEKLNILMLDGNAGLTGTIPEELGELSVLNILTLFDTILNTSLPLEICDLLNDADDEGGRLSQLLVNCTEISCSCDNCSFCDDFLYVFD